MSRSLGLLIGGTVGVWLVVAYPAFQWWGEQALVYSAVAAGLCLVPGVLTLAWCLWGFRGAPETQLLAMMGSMGLRMVFVLAGGIILFHTVPYFERAGFLLWVIAFYLVTLALEMILVVRGRQSTTPRPTAR